MIKGSRKKKRLLPCLALIPAFLLLSACSGKNDTTGIIGDAAYIAEQSESYEENTNTVDAVVGDAISTIATEDDEAISGDTSTAVTTADSSMALHVAGSKLMDASGNVIQLKGVSTHGIGKYPQYVNKDAFRTLRDDWNVNVVRIALYTEEDGGYCTGGDKEALKQLVKDGVAYATELGLYVIIDWHILGDGDPNRHKGDAILFFDEMSELYGDYDNVIYEICNEPNNAPWQSTIRPYAEELISVIRKNSEDAVILVGTNTWSQDVDQVISSPLDDKNVMYVCHFYAATHKESLRARVNAAISAGIPIFISECSICEASGNGNIDYSSAEEWMSFINENDISYIEWNLSNKAEASAIIRPECDKLSDWSEDELSDTAKWFRAKMKENN